MRFNTVLKDVTYSTYLKSPQAVMDSGSAVAASLTKLDV